MIKPSAISPEAKAYIHQKLTTLATEENVRILFAIESGSRAWGFPSADSDYDVRFVYVRSQDDYLSVRGRRDVVETPLENDQHLGVPLDLNGWDVRKALKLALSSNPVLHEWLVSPIRYMADEDAVDQMGQFTTTWINRDVLRYHYDRLARAAWEQIETDPIHVKVKRYCYALRPALMLRWLSRHDRLPPMDVASLCADIDENLNIALTQLFDIKFTCGEGDLIARQPLLDDLIKDLLANKAPRPPLIDIAPDVVASADRLFRGLI